MNTSQPSGALRTPYYSQKGSGILTCDYVISNANTATRKLVTSFEHENLDKGYLLVYEGSMSSGKLLVNITGKSLGSVYVRVPIEEYYMYMYNNGGGAIT